MDLTHECWFCSFYIAPAEPEWLLWSFVGFWIIGMPAILITCFSPYRYWAWVRITQVIAMVMAPIAIMEMPYAYAQAHAEFSKGPLTAPWAMLIIGILWGVFAGFKKYHYICDLGYKDCEQCRKPGAIEQCIFYETTHCRTDHK